MGMGRFSSETGIKKYDWFGKYWTKWSDAIKEAGYPPNIFNQPYNEDLLIRKLIDLIREIGKFPTKAELTLKANKDKHFPSSNTFDRFKKHEKAKKIVEYCEKQGQLSDVLEICRPILFSDKEIKENKIDIDIAVENFGFVYLMKSGKYYKIGRSNSAGRREYELGVQLPEKVQLIHKTSTDDPVGIEAYWHKSLEDKRKNGEWFDLSGADVKAFKRRKFM
ncbi:MAG: GIY-YIG nuclease family protein [Nitrospirae bacterium]|nr:GIY-YIG nuclease family protein [Nitrospirota bacterium]